MNTHINFSAESLNNAFVSNNNADVNSNLIDRGGANCFFGKSFKFSGLFWKYRLYWPEKSFQPSYTVQKPPCYSKFKFSLIHLKMWAAWEEINVFNFQTSRLRRYFAMCMLTIWCYKFITAMSSSLWYLIITN